VSAATQVYYKSFDAVFFELPAAIRARVEAKIDEIGLRLESFPHHRLKGSNRFWARIGERDVASQNLCESVLICGQQNLSVPAQAVLSR
jgi:hypothetical protein